MNLQKGLDFIIAVRSDRLDRSLWPDELEGFKRRYKPEWHETQAGGWSDPSPIVYSAEVDLDMPVVCQCCKETAPTQDMSDDLLCPHCVELPEELREQMLQDQR